MRVKDLLATDYIFKGNVDSLKKIMINPNDIETYLKIDDYYINGLILGFLESEDVILNNLANDFLNRRIWKYVNDIPENKKEIEEIKSKYNQNTQKYYIAQRTVFNSTYKEVNDNFGDKIYILLENGSVSTLYKESKIIESLMQSGSKSDPKFFYRKQ
jgi:hypothetical protein